MTIKKSVIPKKMDIPVTQPRLRPNDIQKKPVNFKIKKHK